MLTRTATMHFRIEYIFSLSIATDVYAEHIDWVKYAGEFSFYGQRLCRRCRSWSFIQHVRVTCNIPLLFHSILKNLSAKVFFYSAQRLHIQYIFESWFANSDIVSQSTNFTWSNKSEQSNKYLWIHNRRKTKLKNSNSVESQIHKAAQRHRDFCSFICSNCSS